MDILVKGMTMPKDCPMCPLSHWDKLDRLTGCELVNRHVPKSDQEYWMSDRRPEWCPLIEFESDSERTLKQIKEIIDIPNTVIQEDVFKYKMICNLLEKENQQ